MMNVDDLIAERMSRIDASGIRKVFDLAQDLTDPVNLSIGQPHFDVHATVKTAAINAIEHGQNAYTVTQGIVELRQKIFDRYLAPLGHEDREVLIVSGTSGGLMLALCALVGPGDEVIVFDPYFVMYNHLVVLAGGTTVYVDTYPDFRIDPERLAAAITSRTKLVIVNSPCNPTGMTLTGDEMQAIAQVCQQRGVLLLSDEVYRSFCYDHPFHSLAEFDETCVTLDGFSKAYGMTGWRLGWASGPKRIVQEMAKLQQFTFVCAPSMVQHAGLAALDLDLSDQCEEYRLKRDRLVEGLSERFEVAAAEGAFYALVKAPWGMGAEFVTEAIRNNLLIIPGNVFSRRDTHFRISYAATDEIIDRGIEILNRIAERPAATR